MAPPVCSDLVTAPGAAEGWLKVGHVIDGEFRQLFGYQDTQFLGSSGAIAAAQNQGFCTVQPVTSTAEATTIPIEEDPQGGIDPLWGFIFLGSIVGAFVLGAVAIYRSATQAANLSKQYQRTRLNYPTAGITEPNPFARALDEISLAEMVQETRPSNDQIPDMVPVYPGTSTRSTEGAHNGSTNEVVGVVEFSSTENSTAHSTAPPMPGARSKDPFDYAPFSFLAANVNPYEQACVWVAMGEQMSQRDALEKIYGIPDNKKNTADWTKARDRFQDIKEDLELQIQRQQEGN